MAAASIIGSAIGLFLLIIVAYVIVNSVIYTADVVTTAQSSATSLNEIRLNTHISLNKSEIDPIEKSRNFSVINTGNEIISDFNHMDIYTRDVDGFHRNTYDKYSLDENGNWSIIRFESDIINPNQLDPGEKMWVCATYIKTSEPIWFQITTGNGVNAQITIP